MARYHNLPISFTVPFYFEKFYQLSHVTLFIDSFYGPITEKSYKRPLFAQETASAAKQLHGKDPVCRTIPAIMVVLHTAVCNID